MLGFALRAQQYLFNRSIWLDEAMLALNIVRRSFVGLTQPLEFNQGAPLGFLFIQKLMVTFFGSQDYILRLFPFIAGVVSLYFFYHLARTTMTGLGQILATYLFSISGFLIYYSSECKQYSSDVMACVLLMVCGQRCLQPDATRKDFTILAIAGAVMLWISHSALFVCCGVGAALLSNLRQKPSRVFMVGGVWAINFLVLYVISFSRLASDAVLTSYWDRYFMPMPPWKNLAWFAEISTLIFRKPVDLPMPWIGPLLVVAGLLLFLIKNKSTGIMICTTLCMTLLASGLRKYPFGDRLLLFAVPIFFLCIGTSVEQLRLWLRTKQPKVAIVFSLVMTFILLAWPSIQAASHVIHPQNGEDIKTVLEYVVKKKSQRDALYIYDASAPAFNFYASRYGLDRHTIIKGIGSRDNPEGYYNEIPRFKGHERIWFIFSHNYNWGGYDEVSFFENFLSKIGTRLDEVRSIDAVGFLYQMR